MNDIVISNELIINTPLNLVWYAWTIPERVCEWFAPEAMIEATVGGAYELYFIHGNRIEMNTKGCKIIKLIDEKQLQFTWKGPDQFKSIMNDENDLTIVNVSFESVNKDSTRVVVEHIGFKDDDSWRDAIDWHKMAWKGVLGSLMSALENGKGNLCCQP